MHSHQAGLEQYQNSLECSVSWCQLEGNKRVVYSFVKTCAKSSNAMKNVDSSARSDPKSCPFEISSADAQMQISFIAIGHNVPEVSTALAGCGPAG
jgi:hypothetical protein